LLVELDDPDAAGFRQVFHSFRQHNSVRVLAMAKDEVDAAAVWAPIISFRRAAAERRRCALLNSRSDLSPHPKAAQ
jgi:hypothetical protein